MKTGDSMRSLTLGLAVLAALPMLASCASRKESVGQMSLYKDDRAREIAFTSYDRAMELWPVEYEETWVSTEYGRTHVVVSGPAEGKPVFLMPGLFADATMWYANVGALAQEYRVYCPDLTVFGGKSEPSEQRVTDAGDYAAWYVSLLRFFGHDAAVVGGLSYGSWLSLALAREVPERIPAIIMLDPSETFMKMDGGIAWKGFWNFMFFPNRTKYSKFFDWLGGGYTDPEMDIWFEHMLDVIEHGSVGMFDVPQHRIYAPEELAMVDMPVLVMAGGKPILYKDPHAFAAAAARALPQAEIVIVSGTGHSLNAEKAHEVNGTITRFLAENYL